LPFVTSAAGEKLNHIREQTTQKLATLFGEVTVTRISDGQRHQESQFPLDGELNLPVDKLSDGVRNRVAKEAVKGPMIMLLKRSETQQGVVLPNENP
jgi:hypothetical protein